MPSLYGATGRRRLPSANLSRPITIPAKWVKATTEAAYGDRLVPTFETIERFLFGFGFKMGLVLAVFAIVLWQNKRRSRAFNAHVFLVLMAVAGAACVAAAISLILPVLLGQVAVPPDFWTKPHPGGSQGFIVGAAIGFVFFFYLVLGEPMRRARRIKSFWGQRCARLALVILGLTIEVSGFLAGAFIGGLIGSGLLPLS